MGMGNDSIEWIKSYLTNRTQVTKFRFFTSNEVTISSGVPQGSIIGPILFLCFTNDLEKQLTENYMVSYADDTQIIVDANSRDQLKLKLEQVIKHAQKWYSANSMMNNISKTEILLINTRKQRKEITITVQDEDQQIRIKPKKAIKVLGVHIDEKLDWKKHTNIVKRNATNAIRNLHRVNSLIPVKERIQLYNAFITPHFGYCDIVWNGCGKTNAAKLQVAQNFAIRSILNQKKSDSATEARSKLKFLTLKEKRDIHEAVFAQKAMTNQLPINITNQYLEQLSKSNMRSSYRGILTVPRHRTSKYQQSPFYRTLTTWNGIPADISTNDTKTFRYDYQKRQIKT
jgi:hypothetical protein